MERYERYKDSGIDWIGEIPAGWSMSRMKMLGRMRSGMGNKKPNDFGSGYPFLTYKDVYVHDSFAAVSGLVRSTDDDRLRYSVKRGDVFFTGSSETIEELGLSGVCVKTVGDATFNGFTIRFRPYEGLLLPEYSVYLFRSEALRGYLAQRDNSITRANLSQTTLGNALVVLPPLDEQRAIADYLDTKTAEIDALITDCEREVELLQEYRKSVISEAVTKGLDPDAPMKDSGIDWIGEIPVGWNVPILGSVACKIGSGKTPRGGADAYVNEGIMLLRSQNIRDGGLDLGNVVFIDGETDEAMRSTRVQYLDVLLNITGASIGRCCLYARKEPANVNQHVCIIRLSIAADPRFVCAFWNSCLGELAIELNQTGSNREGMNFDSIAHTRIPLPPLDEQRAIADYLDEKTSQIDGLLDAKRQMSEKLREYRKSLISEAVTGKFKVPGI